MTGTTIYALASPQGRAGVGVIRLSGPQAGIIAAVISKSVLPQPRYAARRQFYSKTGEWLDEGLLLYFPAPHSYTGEEVVELQGHSGIAVLQGLFAALEAAGAVLAQPGEFTKRAVLNGKLDLVQAEAVIDLIEAETSAQQRQALRLRAGEFSERLERWRAQIVQALAHVEAAIDFADEPLPDNVHEVALAKLAKLEAELADCLADQHRGERLRTGFQIAILGAPNAGKSSLLNALALRDAAIVTATAGTTRDVIDVRLDLGGWPVILRDTAGLRDTDDAIEAEGIRRAKQAANEADLKLALFDATLPEDAETLALCNADTLRIYTKKDLNPSFKSGGIALSTLTGEGMAELLQALLAAITQRYGNSDVVGISRARHRAALQKAREELSAASTAPLPELQAEHLRAAAQAIGSITGAVGIEEVLGVIFSEFCIGK